MTWTSPFIVLLGLALLSACDNSSTPASPTTPTPTGPVTETWTTQIGPRGAVSRTVEAAGAGTLKVTLGSTTPGEVTLGLSVGVPRADGAGCLPTRTVQTAATGSPQIEIGVSSGTYCVQVHDVGTLTDPASFTISIERP